MKIYHHNLEVELDDTWWEEAGMKIFKPQKMTYKVDYAAANGREVLMININEVSPVRRNPNIGIFNNNREATAKERVIAILKGFLAGSAIPPVEVVPEPKGNKYRYKLVHGAHRFYCSLAAGFSHVPATEGSDIDA